MWPKSHLPFSNGSRSLSGLADPKHWLANKDKNCRKRLKAKLTFAKKNVVEESGVEDDEASEHDMEWDTEEEQWVPSDK